MPIDSAHLSQKRAGAGYTVIPAREAPARRPGGVERRSATASRLVRLCSVALACLLGLLVFAGTASASGTLFFGGWYGEGIGRIAADGSGIDTALIPGQSVNPSAMAVSDSYLFWRDDSSPTTIGRSRLDGSEVRPEFLRVGGPGAEPALVEGLSVSAGKLYWTETTRQANGSFPQEVSRANLDGSDVERDVLTLSTHLDGPVIVRDGSVFFANESFGWADVGRVRLNGSGYRPGLARHQKILGPIVLRSRRLYWLTGKDPKHVFLAWMRTAGGRVHRNRLGTFEGGCEYSGAAIGHSYLFVACYYPGVDSAWIERIDLFGVHRVEKYSPEVDLGGGGMVLALSEPRSRRPTAGHIPCPRGCRSRYPAPRRCARRDRADHRSRRPPPA